MKKFALVLLASTAFAGAASAVHAADLIIDEPVSTPGYVEASGNWDGVFVGGFLGYASGSTYQNDSDDAYFDIDGWMLGVDVGANFTITQGIVAGVVADVAWSNVGFDDADFSIDWVGSLRGRLGFDGGAFMPYLTGGLAVAGADFDGTTNTHFGWTAGAGIEFAATDSMSIDLLYRYSDYGSQDYGINDYSGTTHQISVGLNWKF